MKIRRLTVDGFRGLPDREFQFGGSSASQAPRLVVVTGRGASGKTSFLEAIIAGKERVAAYGAIPPDSELIRPGAGAAKVKIVWELDSMERERFGTDAMSLESEALFGASVTSPQNDPSLAAMLLEYELDASVPKLEYFHADRKLVVGGALDATRLGASPMERGSRLTRDDAKYSGLVRFVVASGLGLDVDLEGKVRPQGRVTAAFEKLCSSKKLAGLYRAGDGVFPGFQDAGGRAYGISQLSSSEADAFLFAATFVRSGIRRSVVLVDTPELHKSDAEAKAFVEGLLSIEEENQLIVATRSPGVIGMVPGDRVIQLG